MAKQNATQQKIIKRVMREFKHGEIESNAGTKVKNRKQAIAIGLSEAGASNQKSPRENARARRRTAARQTSRNGVVRKSTREAT